MAQVRSQLGLRKRRVVVVARIPWAGLEKRDAFPKTGSECERSTWTVSFSIVFAICNGGHTAENSPSISPAPNLPNDPSQRNHEDS